MNRTPEQPDHHDPLDALLREWHEENAERARSQRDQLLASVESALAARRNDADDNAPLKPRWGWRTVMTRYMPIAASLALVVTLIAILIPMSAQPAYADGGEIMVPEGGRLEALDEKGNLIGPCALKHTHVDVDVSGFLSRVTLTQEYHNPYDQKIEAVYTFPMSHRGAVDSFRMIVGERVVVGEVKEREEARQVYEQARAAGYVASLLEQERPNIFTQSVANIEPKATIKIEISYIELIEEKDGEYEFSFPMVVGPRYIPGAPTASHALVPAELTVRRGVVLLGPAQLSITSTGDATEHGTLQPGKLSALLTSAQAIEYPGETWWGTGDETGGATQPTLWHRFEAAYSDGSKEVGELFSDGTGWINGRWFYVDPRTIKDMGTGFAQNTNQVPDASKVTPMPVKPPTRAGHDISLTMTIDTGGPGIVEIKSPLHTITGHEVLAQDDVKWSNLTIKLANAKEIPNRDFVVNWKQQSDTITEATFTHTGDYGEYAGGFFTLILQPPARIPDWPVRPRELVFVMDTSGSMSGYPIEKSKEVITRAIDSMRPDDTFNIITFAGHTSILWDAPKPATEANRQAAQQFVNGQSGGGGTEMMSAIRTALVQHHEAPGLRPEHVKQPLTVEELANLPADGREVEVEINFAQWGNLQQGEHADVAVREDLKIRVQRDWNEVDGFMGCPVGESQIVRGSWRTLEGHRVFVGTSARWKNAQPDNPLDPMRIVLFLTDGFVGNEHEIIQHVRDNSHTTRVFSFGIGNSINRHLLDGMAEAGRGEVEYVLLADGADEAVRRFTKRIETPVLTDITLEFSDGLAVTDILPKGGRVPDLFDAKPLVIQGRYAPGKDDREGTLTIRGNTGAGPYERTLDVTFPAEQPEHKATATLWARTMVDDLTADEDVAGITKLGLAFQIMTQHTSFVAVEKSRVTIEGKPVLVAIPIELPDGTRWEGFFGGGGVREEDRAEFVMMGAQLGLEPQADAALSEREQAEQILRQEDINELLKRVRELQSETKYAEALQVTDQILFLDEHNPAALALRDFIHASEKYVEYAMMERQKRSAFAPKVMDAQGLLLDSTLEEADGAEISVGASLYVAEPGDAAHAAYRLQPVPATGQWAGKEDSFAGLPSFDRAPQLHLGEAMRQSTTSVARERAGTDVAFARRANNTRGLAGQAPASPPPPPAPTRPNSTAAGDIRFPWQSSRPVVETAADEAASAPQGGAGGGGGGGGGFGGGGGGGGGGGTIFDDPEEAPTRSADDFAELSPAERREAVSDIVMTMIYSDSWSDWGGDKLRFEWVDDRPVIVPMQRSQESLAQAIIAQAFVDHYLPVLQPDVAEDALDLAHDTDFVDSPANVALLEALSAKRITVSMKDEPLGAVLQAIAEQAGVPIRVEWDVLREELAVLPDSKVTLDVTELPAGAAINALLHGQAASEWERPHASVIGGAVVISSKERLTRHGALHVYDITDLVTIEFEGQRGIASDLTQSLVDHITQLIDPDGWNINGGDVHALREIDGTVFIRGSLDMHRGVTALLAALREAMKSDDKLGAWRVPMLPLSTLGDTPISIINFAPIGPDSVAATTPEEQRAIDEWRRELAKDETSAFAAEWITAGALHDIVINRIEPDGWWDNGGEDAHMREFRSRFLLRAPESTQEQVMKFFGAGDAKAVPLPANETQQADANWAERAVHHMDRLAKVLDPTLLPLAVAAEVPEPPGPGVDVTDEGLRLTVLTANIDDATMARIESHGVTVEGTSPAGPLVVALVPQSALWKLAMLDDVRRIEPARVRAE